MSKKIEVFFDYVCPYCDAGIRQFLDILPEYPGTEVIWRPCEAHPRPEDASVHSDRAIEAFFCLQEEGGDLIAFHRLIYDAHFRKGKRIDDPAFLARTAAACGGDETAVLAALREHRYEARVEEANDLAWEERRLYAVPSYFCDGKSALSRDGILVPIRAVRALLD